MGTLAAAGSGLTAIPRTFRSGSCNRSAEASMRSEAQDERPRPAPRARSGQRSGRPSSRSLSAASHVAVGRLSFVDAPILALRNELHGDRLGWSTALVHELVDVGSSLIDECRAGRVRDAAAMRLVTRIIGHRSSDDEDQARS